MVDLASRHIEDPDLMLHRLGPISRKSDSHEACVETAKRFRETLPLGVKTQYDLAYGGAPHELRYTEIFAGCGGILVAPCDVGTMTSLFQMALAESTGTRDYAEFLQQGMSDKYTLLEYPIKPSEKVVILPGSNILSQSVIKEKLNQAHMDGAKIKPHPLTNLEHMALFKREYGKDVLPKNYSGWKTIQEAKTVYTALGSELGLCAEIFGKEIIDISTDNPSGGYVHFHKFVRRLPKPAEYMNRMLNSPFSGVFFPHSTEDDFREYIDGWNYLLKRMR